MLFLKRLGYLLPWRRRAAERDMQEELRSIAALADPRELGNLTLAAEDARAVWGWTRLEQTAQDVRYALRTLRKSPAFTVAAVLSLAIGIGANTALFTLINSVMWKQLPVSDPEHLLTLGRQYPSGVAYGFTYPQYEIFRDRGEVLDLAAYSNIRLDPTIDGAVEPTLDAQFVSGEYFPILGVRPSVGRLFDESDDRMPMAHPVAVLAHTYWQRRFDGAQDVVGRTITLGGLPFTVVGVTPPEFFGAEVGVSPSLYVPVMMQPALRPMDGSLLERPNVTAAWIRVIGRVKPGVSRGEVAPRLNALGGTPETEWRLQAKFTNQLENVQLVVHSAATGLSELRRQFSQPLFVLLCAAGLVLLIACANVGHLVLARSATRRSEFALRLALGASRGRVTRQVLAEGMVLTGMGAAAGVALAYWTAPALVRFASAAPHSIVLDLSPDLRLLAFTTTVSILAGLLFSSLPAIRASRADRFAAGGNSVRTRNAAAERGPGRAFVVAQVALSVVALVGAGLFVRTLQNLNRHERAIDPERVIVAPLEPRGSGRRTSANAPTFDRMYRDLLARIEALPGVRSASLARSSPLGPSTLGFPVMLPGRSEPTRLSATVVYPRYFATVGLPIVQGRDFNEDDLRPDASPIVLVNEVFAREFLAGRAPLGTAHGLAVLQGVRGTTRLVAPLDIIGVVRDSGLPARRDQPQPMVYQTYLQARTGFGQMVLHVRAARDSADIMRPITAAVQEIARDVPMAPVHTLAAEVSDALVRERLVATLSSIFGLVALALICIGLYGLMAFTVARRTPEIGIRIALGATRSDVRWLVGRQALGIVAAGLAIGVPAAWIAGRLASHALSSLLYEVTSTDPVTIGMAIAVLVVVTMAAGMLPARRAARIDPAIALRAE
jgi:predicted permease